MKAILTIGHYSYLLPSDKGLSTVLATLSKAREIHSDRSDSWNKGKERRVVIDRESTTVEVKFIPESVHILECADGDEDEPLLLPENGYREILGLPEHGYREILGLPEHGTKPN